LAEVRGSWLPRRPACRASPAEVGTVASRQAVILLDPRWERARALSILLEDSLLDIVRIDQLTSSDYVRLVSRSLSAERLACLVGQRQYVDLAVTNPAALLPPERANVLSAPFLPDVDEAPKPPDWNWSFLQIGMERAWDAVDDATGPASLRPRVMVALLDTGVLTSHPDLKPNLWRTNRPVEVEMFGISTACSHGFNIVDRTCNVTGCPWVVPPDENCQTGYSHGTSTAGIIGASSTNDIGIRGVSRDATIVPIVVQGNKEATLVDLIEGIDVAIQIHRSRQCICSGLRVLSISVNINASADPGLLVELANLIEEALEEDIVIVNSAGNEDVDIDEPAYHTYPSSLSHGNIVSVTSSNSSDAPVSGSAWGKEFVELVAPGLGIWTTNALRLEYGWHTGTSYAAPFVSGAAAVLVRSCPFLTAKEIVTLLVSSVKRVDPIVWAGRPTVSGGRLSLINAVADCLIPGLVDVGSGGGAPMSSG
jgi:subtilisin family serine protease